MIQQKVGPREQQLRLQREQRFRSESEALKGGNERSQKRPRWKKQLHATKANANRRDRRKP